MRKGNPSLVEEGPNTHINSSCMKAVFNEISAMSPLAQFYKDYTE